MEIFDMMEPTQNKGYSKRQDMNRFWNMLVSRTTTLETACTDEHKRFS